MAWSSVMICNDSQNAAYLVKEVVLAPSSVPWLEEIAKTTLDKFGLDIPVRKSSLSKRPCSV